MIHSHFTVRERYTLLNANFVKKNRGLQGYTYFSYFYPKRALWVLGRLTMYVLRENIKKKQSKFLQLNFHFLFLLKKIPKHRFGKFSSCTRIFPGKKSQHKQMPRQPPVFISSSRKAIRRRLPLQFTHTGEKNTRNKSINRVIEQASTQIIDLFEIDQLLSMSRLIIQSIE